MCTSLIPSHALTIWFQHDPLSWYMKPRYCKDYDCSFKFNLLNNLHVGLCADKGKCWEETHFDIWRDGSRTGRGNFSLITLSATSLLCLLFSGIRCMDVPNGSYLSIVQKLLFLLCFMLLIQWLQVWHIAICSGFNDL